MEYTKPQVDVLDLTGEGSLITGLNSENSGDVDDQNPAPGFD